MVSQKRQLKRLKKDAQQLWSDQQQLWKDQQALLGRANGVARTAYPHAQHLAKEKVVPGAKTIYDERLKTTVERGSKAGKAAGTYVGSTARDAVFGTVVPAVSSASAAALALAGEGANRLGLGDTDAGKRLAGSAKDATKKLNSTTRKGAKSGAKANAKVKAAIKAGRAAGKAGKVATAVGAAKVAKSSGKKQGGGAGGTIGIVLGILVLAGIGYAVWQTLRADDDLWVADEDPEITPTTDAPTV